MGKRVVPSLDWMQKVFGWVLAAFSAVSIVAGVYGEAAHCLVIGVCSAVMSYFLITDKEEE